jgi:succinate-semialdehyde dehydrogenase/glutarate-semialdehyde dehydrogenase
MNTVAAFPVPLKDEYLFCQKSYVNGAWTNAEGEETLTVVNPATQEALGTVPRMGSMEARRAIQAASDAFPGWSRRGLQERSAIMRKWAELLRQNQDDLATLITAEQGKPIVESRAEILCAAELIEWYAEEGKRIRGEIGPQLPLGRQTFVIKEALGVVAVVTPCNDPAEIVIRKAGPALSSGCTLVLNPSTATPFSALALAELGERAGIPPGVFNVVCGPLDAIGKELSSNSAVRMVAFVGSAETARKFRGRHPASTAKYTFELSGRGIFMVFSDADLDASVPAAIASCFRNTGQAFIRTDRFIIQENLFEIFIEKFSEAAAGLKVGDGLKGNTQLGPLIDEDYLHSVVSRIAAAKAGGGRVVTGGQGHALGGTYYQPTVIAARDAMPANFELPGPAALVSRFKNEREAIRLVTELQPMAAACCFTRDLDRAWHLAHLIRAERVGINTALYPPNSEALEGTGQGGFGEGMFRNGLDEFLAGKYLSIG